MRSSEYRPRPERAELRLISIEDGMGDQFACDFDDAIERPGRRKT